MEHRFPLQALENKTLSLFLRGEFASFKMETCSFEQFDGSWVAFAPKTASPTHSTTYHELL